MPDHRHNVAELTWPEFDRRIGEEPVIVPVGATEQHGRHLPIGTDAIQVRAVAERVAAEHGCLVMPTLSYGYKSRPRSGGGETFPGSTGLDGSTLVALVGDVLRTLLKDGARRIVVLDGHFENAMFLHEAIDLALREYGGEDALILRVLWAEFITDETIAAIYRDKNPGLELEHAGLLETSIMLHLRPELVRREALEPQEGARLPVYDRYPESLMPVPASGALSDGSDATGEIGRRVLDDCVAGIRRMLETEFGPSRP